MKSNVDMTIGRRSFLGLVGSAGAGAAAFGSSSAVPGVSCGRSANGRLRLAVIGTGCQGSHDIKYFARHRRLEMCAFCDADLRQLEPHRAVFPKARFYQHWREMLDKERPDAVLVATPDHLHFEMMSEVLGRGVNLYAQKPLCRTFDESRRLRELAESSGAVTQLGTQIAAWECDRFTVLQLQEGVIGKVEKVWIFANSGYYPKMMQRALPSGLDPIPRELDWGEWIGSAKPRPFKEGLYHPGVWRAWRDFGSGWLGDMGSHLFSPIVLGMGLQNVLPTYAKAEGYAPGWTDEMKREFFPLCEHVVWNFPGVPATGMKPFEVEWCDGPIPGSVPAGLLLPGNLADKVAAGKDISVPDAFLPPKFAVEMGKRSQWRHLPWQGRLVKGTDGWMFSSHFNLPPVLFDRDGNSMKLSLPYDEPVGSHYSDFVDCCLDGGRPRSDFSWATRMTEYLILGNLAIARQGETVRAADAMKETAGSGANA